MISDFYSWASSQLGQVQNGDYVYINSRRPPVGASSATDNHGFIVVGWAPIRTSSCAEAVADPVPAKDLSITWQADTVPYVVDYSYANDPSGTDDRIQTPIARPFYCTQVDLSPLSFGAHNWYFYRLPNTITVTPNDLDPYVPFR
jgi:hypothetical protein